MDKIKLLEMILAFYKYNLIADEHSIGICELELYIKGLDSYPDFLYWLEECLPERKYDRNGFENNAACQSFAFQDNKQRIDWIKELIQKVQEYGRRKDD